MDTSSTTVPAARSVAPTAMRWIVLTFAWLAFLISFVDRLVWASAAVSVGSDLGLPVAALGVFVTAFYVGYVVFNAIGGLLTDKWGARVVLSMSVALLGVGTFAFSFTRSISGGLALQAAMGLAAGADYGAGIKLIVAWFDRGMRGRAMGLYLTASSLGVTLTNAIAPTLLQAIGWHNVYRILGGTTLAIAVVVFLVLRDGPQPVEKRKNMLGDVGLLIRNRNLVFIALGGFGAFWGTWGFTFWSNALMIKGHGLSAVEAGLVVALFGVAAIVGKPLVGALADWLGNRNRDITVAVLVFFTVMLLVFGLLDTKVMFFVAAPALGLAAFIYSPIIAALVTEASGVALAGSATGLTAAFWQVGSVIVPVVVGLVFQATNSFYAAFVTLAAGPLFGAVCFWFVRTSSPKPE